MSYTLFSSTTPRARKEYPCIWCVDKIQRGEVHVHCVGSYDGEFQDQRWHHDCFKVANQYFRESGEDCFSAHECKRGSTEHA